MASKRAYHSKSVVFLRGRHGSKQGYPVKRGTGFWAGRRGVSKLRSCGCSSFQIRFELLSDCEVLSWGLGVGVYLAVAQKRYQNPKWNPGKWKHGPKPAVCPCLILSHTHMKDAWLWPEIRWTRSFLSVRTRVPSPSSSAASGHWSSRRDCRGFRLRKFRSQKCPPCWE